MGGSSMEFFKNSRIDVYAKMWEFMTTKPYVMVNSTREGVEYVRDSEGRYAFFVEAALNDYYNGRFPCDTMRVGKNLDYKGNNSKIDTQSIYEEWLGNTIWQIFSCLIADSVVNNAFEQN